MAIQLRRKKGAFTQDDLDQLIIGQPAIDLDSGTMVVGDGNGGAVIVSAPQVAEEKELREEADNALQAAIEDEASARLELQEQTYAKVVDESTGEELVTIARSGASDNYTNSTQGKTRIDNQLVRVDFTWDGTHESGHEGQDQSHRMFSDYEYYRLTTGDEDIVDESGEVDKVNGRKLAFNTLIWPALTSFSAVQQDYKNNKTDYELITNSNDTNYNKYLKQINIRYPSKSGTLALESDNPWLPGSGSGSVILGKGLANPPRATHSYCVAMGSGSLASAKYSFAHGIQSEASGDYSAAFNYKSKASGPNSFAANNGKATANLSAAFGKATADVDCQFAIGNFTAPNTDALFKVGKGTAASLGSNAFEVLADGRATVQTAPQNTTDVVRKLELDTGINNLKSEFTNTTDTLQGRLDGITIPRVSYTARESNQTSTISNGRLKATDNDSDQIVNVTKWGQIEPMGFTARYNTGKGDASYQQTTVCINPNEVTSIPEGGNDVTVTNLRITPSICYYNETAEQFSICLGLMGYSNIVPGTFTISTVGGESADQPSKTTGEYVFVEGDAMIPFRPASTLLSYSNGRILLSGVPDVSSDINGSEMFVTFTYKQLENYVYLPNKTGTIALKSDLPVFTADGDTLYIDLPE